MTSFLTNRGRSFFTACLTLSVAALLGLAAGSYPAMAHDHAHVMHGPLKIEQPWTRATPGGSKMAGGYLTVTNTGDAPDRLIGGSADVAGRIEIHTMGMEEGVMKMRELDGGLELPPGETVELKPGGFHIMFMGLKNPLVEGEEVSVTLEFEKAGSVELTLPIAAVGAKTPDGAADHSGHGDHSGHSH